MGVCRLGIGFTMVFEDGDKKTGCLHRDPYAPDDEIIKACNETNPRRWGKVVAIEDRTQAKYYSAEEPKPDTVDERVIREAFDTGAGRFGRFHVIGKPKMSDDWKILKVRLELSNLWIDFDVWLNRENDRHCFQMPICQALVQRKDGSQSTTFAKSWSTWDEMTCVHYPVRIGLGAYGDTVAWSRDHRPFKAGDKVNIYGRGALPIGFVTLTEGKFFRAYCNRGFGIGPMHTFDECVEWVRESWWMATIAGRMDDPSPYCD